MRCPGARGREKNQDCDVQAGYQLAGRERERVRESWSLAMASGYRPDGGGGDGRPLGNNLYGQNWGGGGGGPER